MYYVKMVNICYHIYINNYDFSAMRCVHIARECLECGVPLCFSNLYTRLPGRATSLRTTSVRSATL